MKKAIFILILTCLFIIPTMVKAGINDGLVAYYPFNGDVKDYSGNGYDGVADNITIYVNGIVGKAAKFDKYLQLIALPNDLLNGKDTTTVSFWIKIDKPDNRMGIISGSNSSHDNEYLIFLANGHAAEPTTHQGYLKYHFNIQGENGTYGTIKVNDGKFHMVTVVTTPTGAKCYVDGKLDAKVDKTITPFNIESKIWIGNDQDCVDGCWEENQQFYGEIDELRFYNRALSEDEVKDLYEKCKTGSCTSGCSETELQKNYKEGFEAGKKYCMEHPSECGISCGGTLPIVNQSTDNCATFDFLKNVLHIPCFSMEKGDTYWLDLNLINTNPATLVLQNAGKNK